MQHASNVKETTQTTGTGTLALDGAVPGYFAFGDMAWGRQIIYRVQIDNIFEIGLGTVQDNFDETGYELTRDLVLMSSDFNGYIDGEDNDLSAMQISLPDGEKDVFAVALDLSMVSQNIFIGDTPAVGYRADATGSAAMAVGMNSNSSALRSVALGFGASASHENSAVIGNTESRGGGFFCCGSQRYGNPNGFPTYFGDTLLSYVGLFSYGDTMQFPDASTDLIAGKLTIVVVDSTDGNYVGELRWLVIDGSTLVITQALTQIYSTRSGPPTITMSLAALVATDEKAVRATVSGGLTAERIMIKTELFGTP